MITFTETQPTSSGLPSTERDNAYIRLFSVEVMQARYFGAFLCAAEYRKTADNFARKYVADMAGKDEGAISRIFSKPSNMTLKTIAELCHALDVEMQFALVDKRDRSRMFLDVGMRYRPIHKSQQIEPAAESENEINYVNIDTNDDQTPQKRVKCVWSSQHPPSLEPTNYIVFSLKDHND